MRFLSRFFSLFSIVLWIAFASVSYAQTPTESYGSILSDAQIDAWLGRESRLAHPVIADLERKDVSTLHFYFERNYAQRAQSVMRSANDAMQKTFRFLPPETVENVHIYLLGDINRYFTAQDSKGRAPDWAAGLTILRDGVILIRLSPRGTSRIEPEMTLAHELNHVALRRIAGNASFPHWFYEGLAMTATDDWNLSRAETLARASMAGNLLDLEGIDRAFGENGAIVDLAYAQSAHFVSWIAKEYGDEKIRQLIAETTDETPFVEAFSHVYGRSVRAAYALWFDSMSRDRSLVASVFSPDGVFFLISIFAAIALSIALVRRTAARKRRLAAMAQEEPITVLPKNLQNFGPFTHGNSKSR